MCTNIISWTSTHNTVINEYWFESQCVSHGTACWVSCSIVVPVYLSVEILHTRNTNIYHHIEHYILIFVPRNNKCTVYPFQEKYQLVYSSILSYILIYHIFLKYINCSNYYSRGWSVCHGRTFLKTWEKNCLLKVISNIYVTLLCFMLKSVINSIEIDKSLIYVVCY